jgi:hypothetical protein
VKLGRGFIFAIVEALILEKEVRNRALGVSFHAFYAEKRRLVSIFGIAAADRPIISKNVLPSHRLMQDSKPNLGRGRRCRPKGLWRSGVVFPWT